MRMLHMMKAIGNLIKILNIPNHRFPFIASEIFNCEMSAVNALFFEAPEGEGSPIKDQDSPLISGKRDNHTAEEDEEEVKQASPKN